MNTIIRRALCLAALCLTLSTALPCLAASKPMWANDKAIAKLNANRSNDTYRFVFTEPFLTDKDLLHKTRLNTLVEKLATDYCLSENQAKVDTTAHIISFGQDAWFKYKIIDQQEVFSEDVTSNWDWTLYQLIAVSEKNTEPQFDDVDITELYGTKSMVQSIIPGLGQWNKGQRTKAVVIWATEAATIGGAIYFFARDHKYSGYGWDSKAKSYNQMGYLAVGVAAGMYIYNLFDAYYSKGAKKATVKKRDVSTAFAPFATPEGAGLTMALRF